MPLENSAHLKAQPNAPPLTPPLATPGDVVTRRAEGTVFKGNLKALAKYPSHLGQACRSRAHETGILAQNYSLAHLLKGGLHYYIMYTLYVYVCVYI